MTPTDILNEAKGRFGVLLHSDEDKLQSLLYQALGAYQDKAGVVYTARIQSDEIAEDVYSPPADFLQRLVVKDKRGQFVSSMIMQSNGGPQLIVEVEGDHIYPLTITYLVNLRTQNRDTYQIPNEHIPLIIDYLEALIAIPNAERLHRVAVGGKVDAEHIPDNSSLYERKTLLEERMSSARAILPMVTIV